MRSGVNRKELSVRSINNDEIYKLIENTANMLRGMTLDPAVPKHTKSAMQESIQELEESLEKLEATL